MQPTREWLNQPGGLAERLQRLRKSAGLTGDRLAAQLGWPRSKVPKLENGRQMPTEADIRAWAGAAGRPDAVPELLGILSDAQAVHRQWRNRLRSGHALVQDEYVALLEQAARARWFETVFIPGPLQVPGYARARFLEAVRRLGTDAGGVDAAVAARMRMSALLYDESKTQEFCITEAALRFLLCPRQVMIAQLDRLTTALDFGNVTIAIIPFGTELAVAPVMGFLTIDDVTIVETFTSEDTIHGQESARYDEIFDDLMAEAVTGDEARRLIAAAAAYLREG